MHYFLASDVKVRRTRRGKGLKAGSRGAHCSGYRTTPPRVLTAISASGAPRRLRLRRPLPACESLAFPARDNYWRQGTEERGSSAGSPSRRLGRRRNLSFPRAGIAHEERTCRSGRPSRGRPGSGALGPSPPETVVGGGGLICVVYRQAFRVVAVGITSGSRLLKACARGYPGRQLLGPHLQAAVGRRGTL